MKPDPHFISREQPLKKACDWIQSPRAKGLSGLLISGPEEVGKTALIGQILFSQACAATPLVWSFPPGWSGCQKPEVMVSLISDYLGANMPVIEPFLDSFSEGVEGAVLSGTEGWLERLGSRMKKHWLGVSDEAIPSGRQDLRLVIVVEDVERLDAEDSRAMGEMAAGLVKEGCMPAGTLFVFTCEDRAVGGSWGRSVLGPGCLIEEVLVPPFSESESRVLLQIKGVGEPQASTLHDKSGGLPGKLLRMAGGLPQPEREDPLALAAASDILSRMGPEQREWMKIAAVVGVCDPEHLALFLSEQQRVSANRWLCSGGLEWIGFSGAHPEIRDPERRYLVMWQKQHEAGKFLKRTKRVNQLEHVCRVIPKSEHRKLLSLLAEFDWFNRPLIEQVFGRDGAGPFLHLLDDKMIYFLTRSDNYRLTSSARIMMGLYNQLLPPREGVEMRRKIRACWTSRVEAITLRIQELRSQLDGLERVKEEMVRSVGEIDQSIATVQQAVQRAEQHSTILVEEARRSRTSVLALVMQVVGIGCLYSGVLLYDRVVLPLVMIATVLMTGGLFVSMRYVGKSRISQKKVYRHNEGRNRLIKSLGKLKSDKLALNTRREEIRKDEVSKKEEIDELTRQLKEPYLRD